MNRKLLFTVLSLPAAALALSLSGCVDEKIVYKDRELWSEPPATAAGYLGYSKAEDKLTVCGNCHRGAQAGWEETAHADAWTSLQASGHAASTCENCHTISQLGNVAAVDGGWTTTKDVRYYDVQCESCHGPGLDHVSNPSKGTINGVLAPVEAGMSVKTGCVECHNGSHHPYGEEWEQSMHGKADENSATGRAECQMCHTAEDALHEEFHVESVYAEKEEYFGSLTKNLPITCTVCHDPHAKKFEGQLRKSLTEADLSKNLCMTCHYKRGVPDVTTYRGAHSPEGPLLVGVGGAWPDTMKALLGGATRVEATHGSTTANPLLCAGCHMNRTTYKDATGTTISGTGHTFEAIPCVDANGKPSVNGTCAMTERSFKSCVASGCHGSEGAARSAMTTAQMRIANLVVTLDQTLQKVHANWKTCRSYSPPDARACSNGAMVNGKSTFNLNDAYSSAEGAGFNYDMGSRTTAVIHNPMLVEQLLLTSIMQVKKDYGVTVPSTVDLTPQFKQR